MNIQKVTKEYVIDLREAEEDRWNEVISKERRTAKTLIRHVAKDFLGYDPTQERPGPLMGAAMKFIAEGFNFAGGHYQGELQAWAEAVETSPTELTFLNCQYELSHLGERGAALGQYVPQWMRSMVRLGCTAGAVRLGAKRIAHVRNMDWPLPYMAKATRIFRFKDGEREFLTVGIPGMIGALSGMVPGAYSVTIDYAPPSSMPGFDFGPLFLLRNVLETCDTYEEACYALSHTKLSANVLFMVCSAEGMACTIERTRKEFAKIPMRDGVLSVANHFRSGKFAGLNESWDPEIIEDSKCRAKTMIEGLSGFGPRARLDQIACTLEHDPVLNEGTVQMMAFDPSCGEILAWSNN